MRALWLEDRKLSLRDVATPSASDESLVRVLLAGICNTDIELTRGYYPFTGIPGHEFVGEVNGTRVVGEINAACGSCEPCRSGRNTHCDRRSVLGIIGRNGAFADYLSLPSENLHVVPDNVSTDDAVFAEPLAAALQIQEQVKIGPDDRVLVVGDGKLGQLVGQTLAMTGCHLAVVGRHANKLGRLRERGIAPIAAEAVQPRSFDIAVECTGSPVGFTLARKAVRARGTLVMKSTYAGELTFNASSLVVDEITLIGSRCGPMKRALEVLASGAVDVHGLVSETYGLPDAIRAFEHAQRPGVLKVLVHT
jgi:threonine dehydrogenase-like Zn-dependent dehydrogenase